MSLFTSFKKGMPTEEEGSFFLRVSIKHLLTCYCSALGQSPVSNSISTNMGIGSLNWLKPFISVSEEKKGSYT